MINFNWIKSMIFENFARRRVKLIHIINESTNEYYDVNPLKRPKIIYQQDVFEFIWAEKIFMYNIYKGYSVQHYIIRNVEMITYCKKEVFVYCNDKNLANLSNWKVKNPTQFRD